MRGAQPTSLRSRRLPRGQTRMRYSTSCAPVALPAETAKVGSSFGKSMHNSTCRRKTPGAYLPTSEASSCKRVVYEDTHAHTRSPKHIPHVTRAWRAQLSSSWLIKLLSLPIFTLPCGIHSPGIAGTNEADGGRPRPLAPYSTLSLNPDPIYALYVAQKGTPAAGNAKEVIEEAN